MNTDVLLQDKMNFILMCVILVPIFSVGTVSTFLFRTFIHFFLCCVAHSKRRKTESIVCEVETNCLYFYSLGIKETLTHPHSPKILVGDIFRIKILVGRGIRLSLLWDSSSWTIGHTLVACLNLSEVPNRKNVLCALNLTLSDVKQ